MRLIDADRLKRLLNCHHEKEIFTTCDIIKTINVMPTISPTTMWISMKEKQPNIGDSVMLLGWYSGSESEQVIVVVPDWNWELSAFHGYETSEEEIAFRLCKFTHWIPFPTPPAEGGHE